MTTYITDRDTGERVKVQPPPAPAPTAAPPAAADMSGLNAKALVGRTGERLIDNLLGGMFSGGAFPSPVPALNYLDLLAPDRGPPFSGADVSAGVDALVGAAPSQEAALLERQQLAQQNPMMTLSGDMLGDAVTLAALRGPFLRTGGFGARATDIVGSRMQPWVAKAFKSKPAETISKLAGRTVEGGVEGMALSVMQDGDPMEMALYGGASQLFGQAGLGISRVDGLTDLLKGDIRKGGVKLGTTAFAIGAIIQTLKASTPGGNDWILPSLEAGFEKVPWMLALGAISAMTGAGRLKSGKLPVVKGEMPIELMDGLSTLPRAATLNLLQEWTENDEVVPIAERTLNAIMVAPERLSEDTWRAVEEAFESGSWDPLMRLYEIDEKYRTLIDAPDPRLLNAPRTDQVTPTIEGLRRF